MNKEICDSLERMKYNNVLAEYKKLLSVDVNDEIKLFRGDNNYSKNASFIRLDDYKKSCIPDNILNMIELQQDWRDISQIVGKKHIKLFSELQPCFNDEFGTFRTNDFQLFVKRLKNHQSFVKEFLSMAGLFDDTISQDILNSFLDRIVKKHKLAFKFEQYEEIYIEYLTCYYSFHHSSFPSQQVSFKSLICSEEFIDLLDGYKSDNLSIKKAIKIYNEFISHDNDKKGYLSIDDISDVFDYEFSEAFLERLALFLPMSDNQIDFTLFLYLYLNLENMDVFHSSSFFFHLLDIDGDGYISDRDIHFFYKSIDTDYCFDGYSNFLSQLFDMMAAKLPQVSYTQFIQSGIHGTIIKRLIDKKTANEWKENE